MNSKELLDLKIETKESIILSYNSDTLRILNIVITILYLGIISFLIFYFKVSKIAVISIGGISLFYAIFFMNIKNYVSASIKGEMLITKDIFQNNKITALKSIRSINSTTVFGVNYTKVKFKLDGIKHTIRIVKKVEKDDVGNDVIIKSALRKVS